MEYWIDGMMGNEARMAEFRLCILTSPLGQAQGCAQQNEARMAEFRLCILTSPLGQAQGCAQQY